KLADLPITVTETSEAKGEYMRYTSALNAVAGMLAGIAALMAGGVLINLLYLQYYRKKSSLVIMRINGFTPAETAGYVLGESVVTHIVGIVLGIFGGTWLSGYILRLMEGRQFHILRSPQPLAWLIGGLILLIFSAVIHAIIVKAVVNLKPSEDVLIR
ncbi:MAG: ABC transporter permease, partial [Lachnospiraceae bacterium]|nr:ABC transporter permease [Lachnospiraceae bacterium]